MACIFVEHKVPIVKPKVKDKLWVGGFFGIGVKCACPFKIKTEGYQFVHCFQFDVSFFHIIKLIFNGDAKIVKRFNSAKRSHKTF